MSSDKKKKEKRMYFSKKKKEKWYGKVKITNTHRPHNTSQKTLQIHLGGFG